MGLVFPLEVDPARSHQETLLLRSSLKKMWLGGVLLFSGLVIAVMSSAAAPIFRTFWEDGTAFDKGIAIFFASVAYGFPAIALLCWLYSEQASLTRSLTAHDRFELKQWKGIGPLRWGRRDISNVRLSDLHLQNWKGKLNTAAVRAQQSGQNDRYATRGHWLLLLKHEGQDVIIERRAYREDLEMLREQIIQHFA